MPRVWCFWVQKSVSSVSSTIYSQVLCTHLHTASWLYTISQYFGKVSKKWAVLFYYHNYLIQKFNFDTICLLNICFCKLKLWPEEKSILYQYAKVLSSNVLNELIWLLILCDSSNSKCFSDYIIVDHTTSLKMLNKMSFISFKFLNIGHVKTPLFHVVTLKWDN